MDPLHSLHILFKLINFFAFIGLVVYWFSKKVWSATKKNAVLHEDAKQQLVYRIKEMNVEQEALQGATENQKIYIEQALTRLETWRITMSQVYEKAQQEQKIFMINAAHRQDQQQENYHIAQEMKQVVPVIMQQARAKLKQQYTDKKRIQNFDASIVAFLQRHST